MEGAIVLDHKHVGIPEIEAGHFRTVKIRRADKFEILWTRSTSKQTTYSLSPEVYTKKEIVFSTVRNPYDIIATWWALDRYGFSSFLEFINELQDARFTELDYLVKQGSQFIRYEHLNEDLNQLLSDVGLEPVEIPHMNATPDKKPWIEFFDRELLSAVISRFAQYFDQYGYERL